MIDSALAAADIEREARAILAADDSPDTAARLLIAIRDLRSDLETVRKEVERELIARAGSKVLQIEGVGEIQIRKSIKRTQWRTDELVETVVARLQDEPWVTYDDDGDLLPPVERARRLTSRLRDCISFGSGKVTGLKELGVQSDEFCTVTEDGFSVQLPARVQ